MNMHSADATTAEEALAIQETIDSDMATEIRVHARGLESGLTDVDVLGGRRLVAAAAASPLALDSGHDPTIIPFPPPPPLD